MTPSREKALYVGTSGWSYAHWKGVFYPGQLPRSRWFEYYATQFVAVEVNATFYRSFGERTYVTWRDRAPDGFRYVLKAPRLITHRKYLKNVGGDVRRFCDSAALLEEKLGLILLQLAPRTPYDPALLQCALEAFDDPGRVAVEFRHKRWMTGEIMDLLEAVGSTLCAADSPASRLVDRTTSGTAYFRLHGRKKWYAYDYPDEELNEIAGIARGVMRRGTGTVYIFFNNDLNGYAAKNASTIKEMI